VSARVVVVAGPAGSGKSRVGAALAAALGWAFVEGDAHHPAANVARMRAGLALGDAEREPWLAALRAVIAGHLAAGLPAVVACSALRRAYRRALVPAGAAPGAVAFAALRVDAAVLAARLGARPGHFFAPALLVSQLDAWEPLGADEPGGTVDAHAPPDVVVARVAALLAALPPVPPMPPVPPSGPRA
jgi:gluconokinase